ncbi:hypothetical protein GCM10010191_42640 [Actinomadura vinacea]|uniref:Serine/threonine protein kinase n=1 Tax=Actinomadura vinacea TaxID=115336 RepID=A0ABN3JAD9_9ACTN
MDTEPGTPRRRQPDPAAPQVTPLVPPAQSARPSKPLGSRETSGVQVRLGARRRGRERARRPVAGPPPERRRRRKRFVAAGLVSGIAAAGLAAGAIVLLPRSNGVQVSPEPQTVGGRTGTVPARAPRTGAPVEIGTADGSRYRIAAVRAGLDDGVAPQQSSPAARSAAPFIEYVLTNPSRQRVLLDFPGDVFVRRDLVAPRARGRCMWQAGVPESMCTPPIKSGIVRTVAGRGPEPGDGGDKYMAPGASYLVRATVDVPVDRRVRRADMRLYIWKQLYVADQLAKEAPFPG